MEMECIARIPPPEMKEEGEKRKEEGESRLEDGGRKDVGGTRKERRRDGGTKKCQ